MKLAPWQKTVAHDSSRFKLVAAGRRSGKTTLSIRQICFYARIPNREIFYITSSYRAAKMIVWKPLLKMLTDLRWVAKINASELSITLKNGSQISLKGSEDPNRLRGVSLDYVVIDEAAFCDLETLWGEVVRPALADRRGGALFISTPLGKANAFYDMYLDAQDLADWKTYSLTTLEAGFVPEEEIEAARADMTERQFKQEFEASFEDLGTKINHAFDREKNVMPYSGDTRELYIGIDFNLNPMSASIMAKHGDILHVIDEIEIYSSNTDELADEIRQRYPSQKIYAFPDPSGARSASSSSGKSDHAILAQAGFVVKAPRKHDPVRDRINATNARFCNGLGERKLFVDPKCKRTIECLEKHSYKPNTNQPDKDSGYDHMVDALQYCVAYLFPIRKPMTAGTTQNWRHQTV